MNITESMILDYLFNANVNHWWRWINQLFDR